MSMDERIRKEARLIILKELAGQANGRITSTSLRDELREVWGIGRERDWVEAQFEWLREYGAVTIVPAGTVKIACLTETGRRHLRHEITIPGILRPSDPMEV
jgi:hypothetical protein